MTAKVCMMVATLGLWACATDLPGDGVDTDDTVDDTTGGDTLPGSDTDRDTDAGNDTDPAAQGGGVSYCHLQFPCETSLDAGAAVEAYVWVYGKGVTEAKGAAAIEVQIGVGADGSTPDDAWTWTDGSFNVDKGNNDEWAGTLTAPTDAGAYDYAFRARTPGAAWLVCDVGDDGEGGCGTGELGSDDGYSSATAGQLTVP